MRRHVLTRNGWNISGKITYDFWRKFDTLHKYRGQTPPEGREMSSRERTERYEEFIRYRSPGAQAIGRREPYHLTYLKKYGGILPRPVKTEYGRIKGNKENAEEALSKRIRDTRRGSPAPGKEEENCRRKDFTGSS